MRITAATGLTGAMLCAIVAQAAPAAAQLGPRRTTEFATLYATTGLSASCSLPGDDQRRTLSVGHRRDADGNVEPFTVPANQKLVITGLEYRIVTDAARDVHVGVYSSVPGSSYTGHPALASPARSDDEGADVGVAIGSTTWRPGVVIGPGQRPCIADMLGHPIWKDATGSAASGFAYVLIHGFLTTK
jgi:hypothetical protein